MGETRRLREARVRSAMRSGMTELAAQQLADQLDQRSDLDEAHRNDFNVALDLIGELIDWFGAPNWPGPIIPADLARRIADLMERHRPVRNRWTTFPASRIPASPCTGLTASWCPVQGDCTCPDDGPGDDPLCPLHSPTSTHAD